MNGHPLSLSHQSILNDRLRHLDTRLSEYSFACLYLFRKIHRYEVIQIESEVFIKGLTRDKVPYMMVTVPPERIPKEILLELLSSCGMLFPIDEAWLQVFDGWKIEQAFNEDDSDYLFAWDKIAHYPGRHLDGKRNKINQLKARHQVRAEPLHTQSKDAHFILDHWQGERDEGGGETDYCSCKEAIDLLETLQLHGRILYVDNEPAGFIIGEWIGKGCFAAHFSKTISSAKGVTEFLFQDLAKSIEGTCEWINLEQDLGISALRYSKQTYQPDQLLKKWRLAKLSV